jgi:prepilin-type N-terminal cleavage/methylation domain-containing protein
MIARIRKSMEQKDQGFTLIELLVVMIIIGILAAIAIPIFMNQRKKAVDSSAVSDVSTLGKEIATFYVDALPTDTVAVSVTGASPNFRYNIGAAAALVDVGKQSGGMGTPVISFGVGSGTTNATNWCIELPYTGGTNAIVSYSAANGLSKTAGC